ncbi:RNF8 [Branchiostoma lanceolatum]|uniref:RNF8 protein n=1 Tax=Branchiostoma lanceolatum TaxID=7740 RepID=A0A8K0EPW8_BRALA|nr:RNF8 [Branchiostoma lanceolatum]
MVRLEEEKQQMQADLQAMMTLEMQQKEQELLQRLQQQSHALQEEKQQVEGLAQQCGLRGWPSSVGKGVKSAISDCLVVVYLRLRGWPSSVGKGVKSAISDCLVVVYLRLRSWPSSVGKGVEERLQQQLAQQLEEKDKDLEEQLLKHKAALDQIISQKEREHSDLQAKLLQSKLEKEQQEQSVKKVREEVVENVTNVMESELQCNICTELFVQATTLHCSHTFCYACILEWTKTRKMECPTCRTKVTSKTRSLVLDSYIDKMVESYSEELKQHRMDLLQERKEKVATLERQSPRQGKDSPISVGSASSDEEPLSVGSNSSGSGSQWTQSSSSSHNSPPLHSRGGNSASMDNDFVQGDPMAYYGGYGRCHICGCWLCVWLQAGEATGHRDVPTGLGSEEGALYRRVGQARAAIAATGHGDVHSGTAEGPGGVCEVLRLPGRHSLHGELNTERERGVDWAWRAWMALVLPGLTSSWPQRTANSAPFQLLSHCPEFCE